MAFDFLGCAKSALQPGPKGALHFTPYGAAGSTYLIRSQLDADRVASGVGNFCAVGGVLVIAFLGTFVLKSNVWTYVLVAVAVWLVAFVFWTRGIVKSLQKVT
jgi:hypothetical protein